MAVELNSLSHNNEPLFGFQFSGLKVYVNASEDVNNRVSKLLVKSRNGIYETAVPEKVIESSRNMQLFNQLINTVIVILERLPLPLC